MVAYVRKHCPLCREQLFATERCSSDYLIVVEQCVVCDRCDWGMKWDHGWYYEWLGESRGLAEGGRWWKWQNWDARPDEIDSAIADHQIKLLARGG